MIFDKHIFICTNERPADVPRKSCGENHGMEIVKTFKDRLKELKLPIKIRAQKSGCLDMCNSGQTMVIYPEGVFYVAISIDDVEEIIQEHLINNRPVKRLQLKQQQVD